MEQELKHRMAIMVAVFIYGTISWLLGVAGRSSLLAVKEAPGAGMTVATVFATVAMGFLLVGYIAWAQIDFE